MLPHAALPGSRLGSLWPRIVSAEAFTVQPGDAQRILTFYLGYFSA
jgi:hypothetical protein